MSVTEYIKRYILLIIGVFAVGLGIALSRQSNLGISPVSSVANIISIRFDFLSVGTYLTFWNVLLIIAQIIILKKDFKPIQLLQFPIALLLGVFTDLGVMIVSYIPADIYIIRLSLVFCGVAVLAFGITLMIISNTVMNVGEAFVDVVAKKLGKPFGSVKVVFDVSCVALSVVLSLVFFDFKIVGTREGTVITALCTGFAVKFLTKKLTDSINKILKHK